MTEDSGDIWNVLFRASLRTVLKRSHIHAPIRRSIPTIKQQRLAWVVQEEGQRSLQLNQAGFKESGTKWHQIRIQHQEIWTILLH